MKRLIVLLVILGMVLSGCMSAVYVPNAPSVVQNVGGVIQVAEPAKGEVISVTLFSTLDGITDCLKGELGTAIIRNGNSHIFIFKLNSGYAMSGFNIANTKAMQDYVVQHANFVNSSDESDILSDWINSGWNFIDVRDVPQSILDTIAMGVAQFGMKFVTFLVVPVGFFDPSIYGVSKYTVVNQ